MTQRTFIDAAEVADRLAISRHSFLVKRDQLARDHGFPDPMPHCARPLLWRRDEVEAWIDLNGRRRDEKLPDAGALGANIVLLREARTA